MNNPLLLEACVENYEEAIHAQQNGAHRIELCARLDLGGLTPAYDLVAKCVDQLLIPVMAMVRPRGGNFVYNESELLQMEKDIEYFSNSGVTGIVLGLLTADNEIDVLNTHRLVSPSFPLEITFHKAIDDTADVIQSCRTINRIKEITRILTSGGKETALEGLEMLRQMNSLPDLRVKIIAAGKITPHNCHQIAEFTGVRELHGKRIVQNY